MRHLSPLTTAIEDTLLKSKVILLYKGSGCCGNGPKWPVKDKKKEKKFY